MVAMARMKDKQYDLAICDPPYGIGEDGLSNRSRGSAAGANKWKGTRNTTGAGVLPTFFSRKQWDKEQPPESYFLELRRVSKNQIIWGGNYFLDHLPSTSCMIVWDKLNSGDFADCELAWTSFKTAVRKFTFMWNGMLQGDMKHKEKRIHPTQKPVALYKWLLKNYAKPGDKILDTHLGSGSIAIACHDMGFDLTGYEIDAEYFQAAKERLERHQRQASLFLPTETAPPRQEAML